MLRPVFPEDRWGTALDELLEVMARIGFHLEEESPEMDLSQQRSLSQST
ncbi:hypothetical protein ACISU4_11370 [Streptomyces wuyuanensis]